MAQQVLQRLVDDLDGSEGDETIEFSLDGRNLVIDLSEGNARRLREALAPYVAVARRAGRAPGRRHISTSKASQRSREDTSDIRRWLAENGYPVKERGRISDAWQADYEAKSPNPPQPTVAEVPATRSKPAVPLFQAAG
jgi:nucleoid-associated protein Lsr2